MAFVNVDAKYLDWLAFTYLSQDQTATKEIWKGTDLHTDNQSKFNLPSRLIAKVFLFRIIFGGTAYSFSLDPEFQACGFTVKQWEDVINMFYHKYSDGHKWHKKLIEDATAGNPIRIPTGRFWKFIPEVQLNGDWKWPIPKIKNYPVQGLEADLMALARTCLYNKLRDNPQLLLCNTVHDSLLVDCPNNKVGYVVDVMKKVFQELPDRFKEVFKVEFNLPFRGEISVGDTWGTLKPVDNTHDF